MEETKKSQARLFAAEKLASIGGMADGLAHQIKNRLNQFSLAGGEQGLEIDDILEQHAEYIAAHPDLKVSLDYLRKGTDSIVDNVKKTNDIIKGILNFARTEEKENYFSEFSLTDCVEQSVALLKVKHQIAEFPLTECYPETSMVYGIKAQIMECIYNAMDNSYEAAREKMDYHLSKEEKAVYVPAIRLTLTQKDNISLIEIKDNGMGIKEENRFKVFSAFFTTKPSSKSGSGIGSYVVKRMIEENHKGKIWFESVYGQGTTFYIEIPRGGSGISISQELNETGK